MKVLPILFNTEMVRNLLADRKTVTRRVVKPQLEDACPACRHIHANYEYDGDVVYCARCGEPLNIKPPYRPGDILYVRETWALVPDEAHDPLYRYCYKADEEEILVERWQPSIHMPREAARIFLRVTDVRVERLQEVTDRGAEKEGIGDLFYEKIGFGNNDYGCMTYSDSKGVIGFQKEQFAHLWDSTIKHVNIDRYGWAANPWVWVIEFERCEKPQEEDDVDGEKAVLYKAEKEG